MDFLEGEVLLIDKPLHWTSFDVVNKIRHSLKRQFNLKKIKVGHAGTLDPLATGLLIICTGKKTKTINQLQDLNKIYSGSITLGATRPSYDCETEIDEQFETDHITQTRLEEAKKAFLGLQEQVPPAYSAIKVKGKKSYENARSGVAVDLKSRTVTIENIEINSENFPDISFNLQCSKGAYIRSWAHDFGKFLNSGAYLSSLKREAVGTHFLKDAWELNALIDHIKAH